MHTFTKTLEKMNTNIHIHIQLTYQFICICNTYIDNKDKDN